MTNSKKKICFITGSRADYGLMKELMHLVSGDSNFELKIIVTGAHLSNLYGNTFKEIEDDGFKINEKLSIINNDDSATGIAKSIGEGVKSITKAIIKVKPDMIILLGDRYEILSAAISALICNIPVSHIHGGEVTPSCYDDSIRHSVTKMSHLHFVANNSFKKRVIQLGESPKSVFTVGGMGIDSIKKTKTLSKKQLENDLGIKFSKKNLLITFHPETLIKSNKLTQVNNLLSALGRLKNTSLLFTMPNADIDSSKIIDRIKKFVRSNNNSTFIKSLGQIRYFSYIKYADGVVGNSSSGLLEVPAFKKGTINIGDRQKGRPQAISVINCKAIEKDITLAIKKLYSPRFQESLKNVVSPYGAPGASLKVFNIIKKIDLNNITIKNFNDINQK